MKKYIYISIISILLISCNKEHYIKLKGFTQGTTYHITYKTKDRKDYAKDIYLLLLDFDNSLSAYKQKSLISRINNNDTTAETDKYFRTVFDKAMEISAKTNGAFDITVAPLADAWGFGAGEKTEPDSAMVDSLRKIVGYKKVRIVNNKLIKDNPNMKLNVNAIAQGYSVDIICEFLEKKGVSNYLVEIGGELRTKGLNPKGEQWKIGIDKPTEDNVSVNRELQQTIQISGLSVATSGNYRQFYEKEGVKYTHTIDPISGFPVNRKILSSTIITQSCMTADAIATACMVMGMDAAKKLIEKEDNIDGILIFSDDKGNMKTWYSKNMKHYISEK